MIVTSGRTYIQKKWAVLSAYTGVELAVLGVDDRRRGSAWSVYFAGGDVDTLRNLMVWCKGKLPQYKIPRSYFLCDWPRTISKAITPLSALMAAGNKRTAMSDAYIVSGRRTPVGVRGSWFAGTEIADLAAPFRPSSTMPMFRIRRSMPSSWGTHSMAAVTRRAWPHWRPTCPRRAGPTVDSQCCAGLDASTGVR